MRTLPARGMIEGQGGRVAVPLARSIKGENMSRVKLPAGVESEAYERRAAELAAELESSGPVLCGILTRYTGATNTRGARIVATMAGGAGRPSVAVSYPYALDELGRHTLAAMALVDSINEAEGPLSINATRITGACATAEGYAFTIGRA